MNKINVNQVDFSGESVIPNGGVQTFESGSSEVHESGSTTDFEAGSSVDFTGATVTGLSTGGTGTTDIIYAASSNGFLKGFNSGVGKIFSAYSVNVNNIIMELDTTTNTFQKKTFTGFTNFFDMTGSAGSLTYGKISGSNLIYQLDQTTYVATLCTGTAIPGTILGMTEKSVYTYTGTSIDRYSITGTVIAFSNTVVTTTLNTISGINPFTVKFGTTEIVWTCLGSDEFLTYINQDGTGQTATTIPTLYIHRITNPFTIGDSSYSLSSSGSFLYVKTLSL